MPARMDGATRARRGMTLIETMTALVMVAIMVAIVAPRMRTSERQKVYEAARLLAADLEAVRTRSLAATARSQVVFTTGTSSYQGFLDWNRDGTIAQDQTSQDSLIVLPRQRTLPTGLAFGQGSASLVPGFAGAGPISFANTTIAFDSRGLTSPIGTRGTVYIRSSSDGNAVAAVTVTGAANVRVWRWQGGRWQ